MRLVGVCQGRRVSIAVQIAQAVTVIADVDDFYQDGNTRDMIFTVGDLLSRISQTLTLNPGDVLATGTPEGVGYVRTPPWYLQPGDVVEVEVERLGSIRTPVVDSSARP